MKSNAFVNEENGLTINEFNQELNSLQLS